MRLEGFFEQRLEYKDRGDRIDFFSDLIRDKKAMHYGCADWPVFDINSNLHYKLLQVNSNLVGYDINRETIKLMKTLNEFKDCILTTKKSKDQYDILLAPETIEHVFDIESFILEVSLIANTIVITAPNALCNQHYSRNKDNGSEWIEIVHPDHKYWFSLYTLMNSIRMVLDRNNIKHTIDEVGFLEGRTMVYCKYSINE